MRIVFARSLEVKAEVGQALFPGNVEQTRSATVAAIMAFDMKFYENADELASIKQKSVNCSPENPRQFIPSVCAR